MLKKNTRISLIICIIAITLISTAIILINSTFTRKPQLNKDFNQEISFISDTKTISDSISNSEAYTGTLKAANILNKSVEVFYAKDLDSSSSIKESISVETSEDNNIIPETSNLNYSSNILKDSINPTTKLVICPNSSYEESIYSLQNSYTNTFFIIIDGVPHNADNSDNTINYNVIPISFDYSQAGFLAGYACVENGFTNLEFLGDISDNSTIQYGYGFLQGAEYAAKEQNNTSVEINFSLCSSVTLAVDHADNSFKSKKLIIACGEKFLEPICKSAMEHNGYVITCGINLSSKYPCNIGCAQKNISLAISDTITKFYASENIGGKINTFNADNKGISFIYNNAFFKEFTATKYTNMYSNLSNETIKIISDTTISTSELGLSYIKVNPIVISSSVNEQK